MKLISFCMSPNLVCVLVVGHGGACEQGAGQGYWNL